MKPEAMTPQCLLCSLLQSATEASVLRKAVFSKPTDPNALRMTLTPRRIGGRVLLQAETFTKDNKALHENIDVQNTARLLQCIAAFLQVNLLTTAGECEYRMSKSGKSTLIGGQKLQNALHSKPVQKVEISDNNLQKARILSGNEPFLRLLDISDERGRIHDKKQSKFRQINRFLELIRDCLEHLPAPGEEITICDLCCGKSYLSFAAYHYFANVLGCRVHMTGVDLKPDVIEYCNEVAKKLRFEGLSFICGDIAKYEMQTKVHLVISLHACDTATDLVLQKAMEWGTDVILSTPCCHHELNHTIHCEPLSFITKHSMLRQKLCDAATDALRLALLESKGYSVAALELIDPEETPKNIMLRAIKKKQFDPNSKAAKALAEEYASARKFLLGKE